MTELERISTILKEYGLNAKKSFGQNFLTNDGIIKRIVSKMNVSRFQTVIEIGPGLASLTLPLSKEAKKLFAVDADRDMIMVLKDIFKDKDNINIVESDFLRFDIDAVSNMNDRLIIGNLPYNITSELIEYMLEKGFSSAGIMVQKEVSDKLIYQKGKRDNSPLGAFIKMTGDIELITDVDSSCFTPSPKVQSAFVKITQKRKIDFNLYPIVKALFKDPNKTISNCLKLSHNFDNALNYLKDNSDSRLSLRARQLESEDIYNLALLIQDKI